MDDKLILRNSRQKPLRDVSVKLKPKPSKPTKVLFFTNEVHKYMQISDLIITKPGGLSSTEAAAACVPLIHLITIPGCEERNADFFSARGMSVQTRSPGEAASLAVALARDPVACAAMRKRQAEEINPYSARDAVSHVLADLER